MTPSGIETLKNPPLRGHIVYPYTNDRQVAEAVCLFTTAGLRQGGAVLLVMADSHCAPVRERLEEEGFDLAKLESTGRLVCEDAETLLGSFLFDGIIDEHRFKTTIGDMILKTRGSDGNRPVRVFGEMVDLIWTSNPNATERLEQLWNEVIEEHSVPLLCAYSLGGSRPAALSNALLKCHSHAIV